MKSNTWQLKLFGHPRLEQAEQVAKPKRRKSLALFIYLAISRRPCARSALALMFWPDAEETTGRTNLRSALTDLNRVLASDWMLDQEGAVMINPKLPLEIDLFELQDAEQNATISLSPQQLDQWQLPLLEGLSFEECDAFEEWVYIQRESAKRRYEKLLLARMTQAESQHSGEESVALASRLLAFDPLCEPACRCLMQQSAALGHKDRALKYYQSLSLILDEELGIEPNDGLKTLAQSIREGKGLVSSSGENNFQISPVQESEVCYAVNQGVHIAYKTLGSGKPVLVIVWGFVSHLDQLTELPSLKAFFDRLAQHYTVVLFDKRGMGLSDRVALPAGLEETASDIISVLDHYGAKQASVMGFSEGGPGAITCAYHYPDRIRQLVLYGTAAKWVKSDDYPHAIPEERYDQWLNFLEQHWGRANNLEHFAPSCIGDDAMVRWWSKTIRMSASPGSVKSVMDQDRHIDVRECLPNLSQPTLIIQKLDDKMMRVGNGRYLAEHIPNALYCELEGKDHWMWAGDQDAVFSAFDRFHQVLAR